MTSMDASVPSGEDTMDCFLKYDMTHKKRGVAVIFNNETFEDRDNRYGSAEDAADFQRALIQLGFDSDDINVYRDKTAKEMEKTFEGFEDMYKDNDIDCFVCTILTHGGEENMICGSEGQVKLDELLSYLTPEQCPSLTRIPKLIFVQACRGIKMDLGIERYAEGKIQERPSGGSKMDLRIERDDDIIPQERPNGGSKMDPRIEEIEIIQEMPPKFLLMVDMLVFYSTFVEHPAFRDGSWFMQSLSGILIKYGDKYEIMKLLTAVCNKVDFSEYSNKDDPKSNGCKQMPCIMSTLRKTLKFPPKN